MTTEEFIKRAKQVHGDKYDYSKVEYKNAKTKVCIICPIHGEFWQDPVVHWGGSGCPKCKGGVKLNTEEFINRAKAMHGSRYDYSKAEYKNGKTPICIICPEHGEFYQLPGLHLRGSGCPKCKGGIKLNTEEFINKAKSVHGDRYDYSKVEYKNAHTEICIICPEHGEFWQNAHYHLMGGKCPKCISPNKNLTQAEFIKRATTIHNGKYNYSKINFNNIKEKVCIICPEHGEFWQSPFYHLRGQKCPKCHHAYIKELFKLPFTEFINRAKAIHGNKYDYSKVQYIDFNTKVCIICPEHGEFWQSPHVHLGGCGCPICNKGFTKEYKFNLLQEFKDEYAFKAFLSNNDINILHIILRNIEPKFEPIKHDIEKVLENTTILDPIQSLEEKYSKNIEQDNENELIEEKDNINNIDLDNDDLVNEILFKELDYSRNIEEPSIEDMIKNNEQELVVINKIEHMLTPEDREYIMEKFLNDKRRIWIANREQNLNK